VKGKGGKIKDCPRIEVPVFNLLPLSTAAVEEGGKKEKKKKEKPTNTVIFSSPDNGHQRKRGTKGDADFPPVIRNPTPWKRRD